MDPLRLVVYYIVKHKQIKNMLHLERLLIIVIVIRILVAVQSQHLQMITRFGNIYLNVEMNLLLNLQAILQ